MAIGTAAGLFSGLFGVGGGTVIVPLLVVWLGYGEREATGTSLAAIVFIAGFAAAVQGAYGNVHVLDALLDRSARRGRGAARHVAAAAHAREGAVAAVRGGAGGLGGGVAARMTCAVMTRATAASRRPAR